MITNPIRHPSFRRMPESSGSKDMGTGLRRYDESVSG